MTARLPLTIQLCDVSLTYQSGVDLKIAPLFETELLNLKMNSSRSSTHTKVKKERCILFLRKRNDKYTDELKRQGHDILGNSVYFR